MKKKRILLKLTGGVFLSRDTHTLTKEPVIAIIKQLKQLRETVQCGIVIGGGNFFRGNEHGKKVGITAPVGHQVGLLGTMMHGLILKDLLEQHEMPATVLCAIPASEIGTPISQQAIENGLRAEKTLVFTGGTGNPFFTTDTNAVLRALQISADEIWKATDVDGIYNGNPKTDPNAKLLKKVTFEQALTYHLRIMDATSYALAAQHDKKIRIFNAFKPDALLNAAHDPLFGSIIEKE